MKIMITGGMGFIGSHLSEQLLIEKHDLVILTKSFVKKHNITNISKKIKIEKIDVTDFKKGDPVILHPLISDKFPMYFSNCDLLANVRAGK